MGGLKKNHKLFNTESLVINAVNVENLYETTLCLINQNVKKILVEKPGSLSRKELSHLYEESKARNSKIFIAYNRRFYNSICKAKEIIKSDGGLKACSFEFTEFTKKIELSDYKSIVKDKWLLANSSHVIDTAFYISGFPSEIQTFIREGDINWHKSGAGFSGAGITKKGVLFSYE